MKARFFRSDAMVERLGEHDEVIIEAEWFQITYDDLRVAPDGDEVARYDAVGDSWVLNRAPAAPESFSDVVIFNDEA